MTIKAVKAKYIENNFKLRQRGVRLVPYKAPCCGAQLESQLAGLDEEWEALTTCPECGELFMKYTSNTKITAETLTTK